MRFSPSSNALQRSWGLFSFSNVRVQQRNAYAVPGVCYRAGLASRDSKTHSTREVQSANLSEMVGYGGAVPQVDRAIHHDVSVLLIATPLTLLDLDGILSPS